MSRCLSLGKVLSVALIACALGNNLNAQDSHLTEQNRLRAEIEKLNAERDKLRAEAASLKDAPWVTLAQTLIAALAILTPIIIALQQVREQRLAVRERGKIEATLKAAEIAMDAPTSGQVGSRAQILATLLKDLVPDFGNELSNLDFKSIGFNSYRVRFSKLLEAIAGHPEYALLIAETYRILFPNDNKRSDGRIDQLLIRLREFERGGGIQ
jgi:hypothetical protein